MRLKDIKTIDVFTRWFYDEVPGNPYYSRKVVVNIGTDCEQTFVIKNEWGSVDSIGNDYLERLLGLPKSISFTDTCMFRYKKFKLCKVRQITYTYHKSKRVYDESALNHPERFKNV
jgi:hypothetical protein